MKKWIFLLRTTGRSARPPRPHMFGVGCTTDSQRLAPTNPLHCVFIIIVGAPHLTAFLAPITSDVTVTVTTICSLNLCSLCTLKIPVKLMQQCTMNRLRMIAIEAGLAQHSPPSIQSALASGPVPVPAPYRSPSAGSFDIIASGAVYLNNHTVERLVDVTA